MLTPIAKLLAFCIFIMSFCVAPVFAKADKRPNILVILADDLGYGDLGYTGAKDIFTPNIDKLAAEGVEITNGYVTHPYCGPSRAGLITGRYQARFGMEINVSNSRYDEYSGLPTTEQTFAKRLQKVGYRTGVIGKWHLGASFPFHPNNRGFDYFFGFLSGGHTYFPKNVKAVSPLRVQNNPEGKPHYSANEGSFWPLHRNNKGAAFNEYLTTALSRDAAEFVKAETAPFLLYLAYNAPHAPLEAPKETIEKYTHIGNKNRRIYAAMIDEMDQGIGMIVDALKASGKFDNTLIFFLSDNGGAASVSKKNQTKIYSDSGPFRDGKGSMREGGSHVPFIAHWPAGIKKTGKFSGLVSSMDIAATAVALGHGDTSGHPFDGVNIIPYLNGKKKGSPHPSLYWRTNYGRWAVRSETTKYLLTQGEEESELYDMVKDPYETNNIVDKAPRKRKAMANLWNDWNKDNINNILLESGSYQKQRLKFYEDLYAKQQARAKREKPLVID